MKEMQAYISEPISLSLSRPRASARRLTLPIPPSPRLNRLIRLSPPPQLKCAAFDCSLSPND